MSNQIAETILRQLGGNQFVAMTGAKQLVASENGLTFKLPCAFAKDGIVCVSITLEPSDTYTVKAYNAKGVKTCIAQHVLTDIYADRLELTFSQLTGLDTHL